METTWVIVDVAQFCNGYAKLRMNASAAKNNRLSEHLRVVRATLALAVGVVHINGTAVVRVVLGEMELVRCANNQVVKPKFIDAKNPERMRLPVIVQIQHFDGMPETRTKLSACEREILVKAQDSLVGCRALAKRQ